MNLLRTFAVGMALLALAATPASAQSGGDLERITLQLRWEYEFQFAGFVAARELGYYREVGLDVELRELHFGMSVYDELRSGRAQYAVGTTDAVVERASGTPVVALAAIFQHSPFVIISREDAGIRAPEDLVGRRVSTYDTRNTILEAMLHSEGVDAARVDFVPYDQDYARIASGEVSATTAVITLQPYAFEQMGIPFSIMYPRTYGIDFYGNTLITLEDEVGVAQPIPAASRDARSNRSERTESGMGIPHRASTPPVPVLPTVLTEPLVQRQSRPFAGTPQYRS